MKFSRWFLLPVGLLAAGAALFVYRSRPDALALQALGASSLPASVHIEECKGWGVTDVLYTCTLRLSPGDLPVLLAQRRWAHKPATGLSHSFASGPKVGEDFDVAEEFTATSPEFKHGGLITVVVSADHRRAQIDYYEE